MNMTKWGILALIVIAAALFVVEPALASTASSGTSFDRPLTKLRGVFTGPLAYTFSLLGVVVAGGMLIFGGELGDFAKRLIMLILVIAIVAFAAQLISTFFNLSGAVVRV